MRADRAQGLAGWRPLVLASLRRRFGCAAIHCAFALERERAREREKRALERESERVRERESERVRE